MHPQTVVALLGLNLLAIGALLWLIARRATALAGVPAFAVGSMVFGLAYLLRLALGHTLTGPFSVMADAAMVFATLCYVSGMRRFGGRTPLGRRRITGWVLGFALASLAATAWAQGVGRHAVLNLALAAAYLVLAGQAASAGRREPGQLSLPLFVFAVVMAVLGLATAARGVAALLVGVQFLFDGLAAQVYYGFATLVSVVMGPNLLWMVFLQLNQRLATLATHDPLTGLLNRNGLDEALQRHFGGRPPRALVLLQVDVDHFKRVNDQHGHAAGDAVLQGVARSMQAQLRASDFLARLGGEEFLVGCDGTDIDQATTLAERLRQAVAAQDHVLPSGLTLRCTVSIGVSRVVADRAAWEQALRSADRALYAAKQAGRDRVVLAPVQNAPA